jgi:hypothetical protein
MLYVIFAFSPESPSSAWRMKNCWFTSCRKSSCWTWGLSLFGYWSWCWNEFRHNLCSSTT